MKPARLAMMLAAVFVAGCATGPQTDGAAVRVSPDYVGRGDTQGLRPFVYGGKTVFDVGDRAVWLRVYDADGRPVPLEKVGRYYRAGVRLQVFSTRLNMGDAAFEPAPAEPKPVPVSAVPAVVPELRQVAVAAPAPAPARPRPTEAADLYALLNACAVKLVEVRSSIEASPADAATPALRKRLAELEAELVDVTTAHITTLIQFERMETTVKLSDAAAAVLVRAARAASHIDVTGHTDSTVAGPQDARIAAGRAQAARDFLVGHGVEASRITVTSTAAGAFLAPNTTKKGRALNRRAEVQLRRESPALEAGMPAS